MTLQLRAEDVPPYEQYKLQERYLTHQPIPYNETVIVKDLRVERAIESYRGSLQGKSVVEVQQAMKAYAVVLVCEFL